MSDEWDEPTKVDGMAALPMMYDANKAYVLIHGERIEPLYAIDPIFIIAGILCFILWARGESGKVVVTQDNGQERRR